MGDSTMSCHDEEKDPEVTKCDEPKVSIDVLRESKPLENMAIEKNNNASFPDVHTMFKGNIQNTDSALTSPSNIPIGTEQSTPVVNQPPTSLSNIKESSEVSAEITPTGGEKVAVDPPSTVPEKKTITETILKSDSKTKMRASSASLRSEASKNLYTKNNSSDIFSLKDTPVVYDAIYSINGSPSRKVFRKWDHPSQIFPPPEEKKSTDEVVNQNIKQRPSTVDTGVIRNPVTGSGVFANDEYNLSKMSKRKDGNPVTGVGYESVAISPSKTRIPPGGYSKGLW